MEKTFKLEVNGKARAVTTDPDRPLLDVLREEFHLTGAKYGCGEGQCRACTVLLDNKAVPSCLTSIAEADGRKVLSIEGLTSGDKLHPVQEAFLTTGAFQCGYCTAGMIMGVVGLVREKTTPSETDLTGRMQKHLCRCCSYPRILTAARAVLKNGGTGA
jgi:aerobic carbon-monoxide dehydrogenase small subunit